MPSNLKLHFTAPFSRKPLLSQCMNSQRDKSSVFTYGILTFGLKEQLPISFFHVQIVLCGTFVVYFILSHITVLYMGLSSLIGSYVP